MVIRHFFDSACARKGFKVPLLWWIHNALPGIVVWLAVGIVQPCHAASLLSSDRAPVHQPLLQEDSHSDLTFLAPDELPKEVTWNKDNLIVSVLDNDQINMSGRIERASCCATKTLNLAIRVDCYDAVERPTWFYGFIFYKAIPAGQYRTIFNENIDMVLYPRAMQQIKQAKCVQGSISLLERLPSECDLPLHPREDPMGETPMQKADRLGENSDLSGFFIIGYQSSYQDRHDHGLTLKHKPFNVGLLGTGKVTLIADVKHSAWSCCRAPIPFSIKIDLYNHSTQASGGFFPTRVGGVIYYFTVRPNKTTFPSVSYQDDSVVRLAPEFLVTVRFMEGDITDLTPEQLGSCWGCIRWIGRGIFGICSGVCSIVCSMWRFVFSNNQS